MDEEIKRMEKICIEAYEAGNSRPLQDVIDDLKKQVAIDYAKKIMEKPEILNDLEYVNPELEKEKI